MQNKISAIIIDREENSRNVIKSFLAELSDIETINEFSQLDEKIKDLKTDLIFIDVSEQTAEAIGFIKDLKNKNKDLTIIALSNRASTDIIIKTMRAGAKEFITKPIIKTDFAETVSSLINELENNEPTESCKVISTFSNKGGIGKTSIAVNLGVELAQMTKERVALIDLNLQLGDVATFLDVNPSLPMDYIADNIKNLDNEELLQSLTRYKNTTLYVIADPLNIDKTKEITAEQINTLIKTLKKSFSYIVIDIGSNIDSKTITALNESDLILLIAIMNLPAIRSTQRCMELFTKLGYTSDKIKLVLNRYMENEDIKTSDIEEVVQQKVYWKIPNNYLTMMSAINKGVPLCEINQEANISLNYKEFATKISDYLITQKLNKYHKI